PYRRPEPAGTYSGRAAESAGSQYAQRAEAARSGGRSARGSAPCRLAFSPPKPALPAGVQSGEAPAPADVQSAEAVLGRACWKAAAASLMVSSAARSSSVITSVTFPASAWASGI